MKMAHRNLLAIVVFLIVVGCAVPYVLLEGHRLFQPESPHAVDWSDRTIRNKTYQYVFRETGEGERKLRNQLRDVYNRVPPIAAEILVDEANSEKLLAPIVDPDGTNELPLYRACQLIFSHESRSKVAPAIVKFAGVADENARGAVCKILAYTGDDAYLPIVLKALESTDDVWDATTDGLEAAIDCQRLSPTAQVKLWDVLERGALQPSRTMVSVGFLCELDRTRAVSWADEQGFLQARSPLLMRVLIGMSNAKVLPGRTVLHHIIDGARNDPQLPDRAFILSQCCEYLAYYHNLDDELFFSSHAQDTELDVSLAAAHGLFVWRNLDRVINGSTGIPTHRIYLPDEVRIYKALWYMNWKVSHDGFRDYFSELADADWEMARRGLLEIDETGLELMDAALAVLRENGASQEPSEAVLQLSVPQLEILQELSAKWALDEQRRKVRILLYAISKADRFLPLLESK